MALPYPITVARREFESEPLPDGGGVETFDTPEALELNQARLAHLESLELPLQGKSVLDVGCGVGHLAAFFRNKGCRVLCLDGREENVRSLRSRHPDFQADVANVEEDLTRFGAFDIVLCYGLLYHLENPIAGMRNIAAVCGEMLLLETIVCDHSLPVIRWDDETKSYNQALRGIGCRPSPSFVTMLLNRVGFSFVYAPASPPQHPDFEVTWTDSLDWQQNGHLLRCVFVASRNEITNGKLLSLLDGSEAGPQGDHQDAPSTDGAPSDPELP